MDFDYSCSRKTPSVVCMCYPFVYVYITGNIAVKREGGMNGGCDGGREGKILYQLIM